MQLKEKELLLRKQELARQQQKDKMDERRKESLAGLTKYYGDALKHAYFLAVENLFTYIRFQRKFNRNCLFHCLMSVAKLC